MNIIDHFIKVVSIASPSGKEQHISLYLQYWLTKKNFIFKVDAVGNIYATNGKKGTPLMLCAHMDTVQPGEHIHPVIKDGIIQSDGTTILGADNKAALAAILHAVESVPPEHALELLFTVKEETGGGVEHFPFTWIHAKKALIFDSANPLGGIVLQSPSIYNFDIVFTGKSAHASTPKKGINAFTPAFGALAKLPTGTLDGGQTTINIGLINGGTGINTVPNSIHIQGEVRSYSAVLFKKHLDAIKKTVIAFAKKQRVKVSFKLNGYCAGYTHKKEYPFINSLSTLLKKEGLIPVYHTHSGISDANVLNAKGIQTINLADGVQNPHTLQEQVKVKDLEQLSRIIQKCIREL